MKKNSSRQSPTGMFSLHEIPPGQELKAVLTPDILQSFNVSVHADIMFLPETGLKQNVAMCALEESTILLIELFTQEVEQCVKYKTTKSII